MTQSGHDARPLSWRTALEITPRHNYLDGIRGKGIECPQTLARLKGCPHLAPQRRQPFPFVNKPQLSSETSWPKADMFNCTDECPLLAQSIAAPHMSAFGGTAYRARLLLARPNKIRHFLQSIFPATTNARDSLPRPPHANRVR